MRRGDWVRFYQNARLVIGVVMYIRPREAWEESDELQIRGVDPHPEVA